MTEALSRSAGPGAVLVIDDQELAREAARCLLEPLGVEILEAAGGREGLALLEAHPEIRVVVLDLHMPGLGGEQVLAAIRARGRSLPVVILSGALDERRRARLLEAGASSCLNKAQAATSLARIVEDLLAPRAPLWW